MTTPRRVTAHDFNDVPTLEDNDDYGAWPFTDTITTQEGLKPEFNGGIFLDAYDFISQQTETPEPLWGDADITAIPAGGLCLLAGRPGTGKTTLMLDLACHLAAGKAWPPSDPSNGNAPTALKVPRPLRVALIENEGPQEMFRLKLFEKMQRFPHPVGRVQNAGEGCLMVQTWAWGSYTFADRDAHQKTAEELDEYAIDIVMGDPLGSLGPEGVGSPADTRNFVSLLRPLGLGAQRAFLFLHHFRERVDRTEDELARISGAWGGHLDTLLTLSSTHSHDQARLAWPKLRWAKRQKPSPIILGRVWNTGSFEALGDEDDATVLEPTLTDHFALMRHEKKGRKGEGWFTTSELAADLELRRKNVQKALEGAPHLFMLVTGPGAKELGASPKAKLWGLNDWDETTKPEQESL